VQPDNNHDRLLTPPLLDTRHSARYSAPPRHTFPRSIPFAPQIMVGIVA
jgi:hypothetical protein